MTEFQIGDVVLPKAYWDVPVEGARTALLSAYEAYLEALATRAIDNAVAAQDEQIAEALDSFENLLIESEDLL